MAAKTHKMFIDGKYAQGNAGEVQTPSQRAVQNANRSQLSL